MKTLVKVVENDLENDDTSEFHVRVQEVGEDSQLTGEVIGFKVVRDRIIDGKIGYFAPGSYIFVATQGHFERGDKVTGLYTAKNHDNHYDFPNQT